jgi:PhnB protein
MPEINAYLTFDGSCAEAMRFYESTLGGKLSLMTVAESPMASQASPATANRVIHAHLSVDGAILLASDSMPGHAYDRMQGFSVSLNYSTAAEARRIFDALAAGGQVIMPIDKTFWSEAFGMLVDRFGTPWMVNTASPRA